MPADVRPRVLSTAIDEEDASASLDLALAVAPYFDLTQAEARKVASETGRAVANWRQTAVTFGIARQELERMRSAFEHRDLEQAVRLA